jgi:hypothetical protein
MTLKLIPVLEQQSLWSFSENTKVLFINHEHSSILVRSNIENDDKTLQPVLVFEPDDGHILTSNDLVFVNGKLKPWWSLESAKDPKNWLDAFAIVKTVEVQVKEILENYRQTQSLTDANLTIVIDYFQDLLLKVQSLGSLKFYLFEHEIVRELEHFRRLKVERELKY